MYNNMEVCRLSLDRLLESIKDDVWNQELYNLGMSMSIELNDIIYLYKFMKECIKYCLIDDRYWLYYINDIKRYNIYDDVILIYKIALENEPSVELWLSYLNYEYINNKDYIRLYKLYEKSIDEFGLHALDGPLLWSEYRKFIENINNNEDDIKINHIRNLFYRQLSLPLGGLSDLLDEYIVWENELKLQYKKSIKEGINYHKLGYELWENRKCFELKIQDEFNNVIKTNNINELWNEYIEYELNNGNYNNINIIYKRALDHLGYERSDLWINYANFILKYYPYKSLNIYKRATKYIPNCINIWINYLLLHSTTCHNIKQFLLLFKHSITSTNDLNNLINLHITTADCIRRIFPNSIQEFRNILQNGINTCNKYNHTFHFINKLINIHYIHEDEDDDDNNTCNLQHSLSITESKLLIPPKQYYPHEVTSTVGRPADSSPPEVGLADSSSNLLSQMGKATPRDRGNMGKSGEDGGKKHNNPTISDKKHHNDPHNLSTGTNNIKPEDVTSGGKPESDLRELEGEVNRRATTASGNGKTSGRTAIGTKGSTGPRVEPGSDPRELEGDINREADGRTTSGGGEWKKTTSSGEYGAKEDYGDNKPHNDNKPHDSHVLQGEGSDEVRDGSSIMGMMEDGSKDVSDVTSSGMKGSTGPQVEPAADLREAEGEVIKRADGRNVTSGGDGRTTSGGSVEDMDITSSGLSVDCMLKDWCKGIYRLLIYWSKYELRLMIRGIESKYIDVIGCLLTLYKNESICWLNIIDGIKSLNNMDESMIRCIYNGIKKYIMIDIDINGYNNHNLIIWLYEIGLSLILSCELSEEYIDYVQTYGNVDDIKKAHMIISSYNTNINNNNTLSLNNIILKRDKRRRKFETISETSSDSGILIKNIYNKKSSILTLKDLEVITRATWYGIESAEPSIAPAVPPNNIPMPPPSSPVPSIILSNYFSNSSTFTTPECSPNLKFKHNYTNIPPLNIIGDYDNIHDEPPLKIQHTCKHIDNSEASSTEGLSTDFIHTENSSSTSLPNIHEYTNESYTTTPHEVTSTVGRPAVSSTPEVTITSLSPAESSPLEVQSTSTSTRRRGSTPEVTTTVGLADSSSNYLSLKGKATPRDRGGEEGCDGSSIMGMMEDGSKDVLDVTSSGRKSSTRPRVEPVADLREAEGEVNRGGTTPSGSVEDSDITSSGMGYSGDKKPHKKNIPHNSDNKPHDSPHNSSTGSNNINPEEREDNDSNVTSSGLPAADLREAEGEVNREADGRTKKGGDEGSDITSSGMEGGHYLLSRGSVIYDWLYGIGEDNIIYIYGMDGIDELGIIEIFSKYDGYREVRYIKNRNICYIEYDNSNNAKYALECNKKINYLNV